MLPFLRDGDRLEVKQTRPEDIRPGDIVTYRDRDKFPTRRVIGSDRAAAEFLIQADYSPARVFRVPGNHILGRVEARIREGKRLDRSSLRWRFATWRAFWRKRIREAWRPRFRQR